MPGKFELFKDDQGRYRFSLKTNGGDVILSSEAYATKGAAETAIASVREIACDDRRYARKTAQCGQPMFKLFATNGQLIGRSEPFSSEADRDRGIETVKVSAPSARIVGGDVTLLF